MRFARIAPVSEAASGGSKEWIASGLLGINAHVRKEGDDFCLHLGQSNLSRLGLVAGQKVGVWRFAEGYKIGPYFGIMTNKRPGERPGFSGLRGRRENYTALLRVAQSMGAVGYVFAVEDVDFKRLCVTGYRQRKNGQWHARTYPLPDVVYNRVPDRLSEKSGEVIMAKKRFEQLGVSRGLHFFNPHFLNKYQLYKVLSRNKELREYLPETKVYRSPEDISNGLKKYGMVYLKPRDSFAGHGIMRASVKRGRYELSVKSGNSYRHIQAADFQGLTTLFQRHRKPGVYLVQQGLRLAKYKGSIFDARIIVQKDGEGNWMLSGAGVRVAGRGGITTHVPNGGYIAPIKSVIREVFNQELDEPGGIYECIQRIALMIATSIENHYGKLFGELSMDIGIDRQGICYFFEANAKPMKFDEPVIRKQTLRRLIEFSRFLSGYNGAGVEPCR